MSSLDWAVIALGAGGIGAVLAAAAAVAQRRRRRTELAVMARGRNQPPETRIEVVAINDAKPERHSTTIERN